MKNHIKQAAKLIEEGKLVCLPTETVYGVATNALNKEAVTNIYHLKGRDFKNPLALMASNIDEAKKYVKVNDAALQLGRKFCPGPLTLVLPKNDNCIIEGYVNANLETLAVRIVNNNFVQAVLQQVQCPIVFTSANPSGQKEAVNADQVLSYFGNKVDMVVQGKGCSGRASTIVDLCQLQPKILREGEVSLQQIQDCLVGQ